MRNQAMEDVLAKPGPLLLDFDGPVCSVFANYSASDAAAQLKTVIQGHELNVPQWLQTRPMHILMWAEAQGGATLAREVDDVLRAAEVNAVQSATPTPAVESVLWAAKYEGKTVAIVSNNSEPAITTYLDVHQLRHLVATVVGRKHAQPSEMKPSPIPLYRAAEQLEVAPTCCVFVGDSKFDVDAGVAACVPVIGYANKAGKSEQLAVAGAAAVVNSMAEISEAIEAQRL